MDGHKGEGYSDQSGTDYYSYSHSDDSSNHHQQYHNGSFDNHRWDASDDHQQTDEDDRFHYHDFSFSTGEQSNSPSVWEDSNGGYPVPIPGRKRDFNIPVQASSRDCAVGNSIVKLYVGALPRTVTEGEIRSVFGEHGNVVEVVILKDKQTGQQQECCFVKYSTIEEADLAIWALHGQYTFSGGRFPIKVKYADGERDRLAKCYSRPCGALDVFTFKLYVRFVNKLASKAEIEEIFSPFGIVEEVFIVRDEMKQPKGCAFVQFSHREMAIAAINALHGSYVMRGCEQPLVVRFADPKKPRVGDSRTGTAPSVDRVTGQTLPSFPQKRGDKPIIPISCGDMASENVLTSSFTLQQEVSTTMAQAVEDIECEWSEHICPDGYPYYYNCVTCESKWEKPEEYRLYEQHLLKLEQPQQ